MELPKSSRNQGRGARKRLKKRLLENVISQHEEKDGTPPETYDSFRSKLNSLPPEQAAAAARALLTDIQQALLSQYKNDLGRMSSGLSEESAWVYLVENLSDAKIYGVEDVLRQLVLDSAGKLADPKMLRLTARYSPR